MIDLRIARSSCMLPGALVVGASIFIASGCDESTGTPPVLSAAEIQKQQADELAARQKAYGSRGVPTGRFPAKAAAKPSR